MSNGINWGFSFDPTGIKPTGVAYEELEDGGYAVDLLAFTEVDKKDQPGQKQIKVDYITVEPGFVGVEKSTYLQIPQPIVAGMSEHDVKVARLTRGNWVALLLSVGYTEQQIASQGTNLQIHAGLFHGKKRAYINVTSKQENVLDQMGNAVRNTDGSPRTRRNENRNFVRPEDYAKVSISRRQALAASGGQPTAPAPAPQPAAPAGLPTMAPPSIPPAAAPGFSGMPTSLTPPNGGLPAAGGFAAPPAGLAGVLGATPR